MRNRDRRLSGIAVVLGLILLLLAGGDSPARSASSTILITAVYYDTYLDNEPDEAFRLMNVCGSTVDLSGWTVTDGPNEGTITLQGSLAPGASIWIAREADDFTLEFGFPPAFEYGAETDPTVPNLDREGTVALANSGDQLVLKQGETTVDQVVWEEGDPTDTGWIGPAIWPYVGDSTDIERFARPDRAGEGSASDRAGEGSASDRGIEGFGYVGQILYRKLDQSTALPVADSDTAADWAQATDDDINGKKVQYPGWDLEHYFIPASFAEPATLTYAVAPDHIYETVVDEINGATTSILYEGYTFKNAHLAEAMVARMTANPGMTVRLLIEGGPVGGITNQEKWICQQIEEAGGEVYFMHTNPDADVHDRYHYQHGKWMIIDGDTLLTGSENLNYSSMPADDKADGTAGNRGVWLITDAPSAIAHALDVFEHDLDPANHRDLARWTVDDPDYGAPPPEFTPDYSSGGSAYPIQFPAPLTIQGTFAIEMVQSPENSLRDSDSLLGMVACAGAGDTVLVEQLYEYTYWGDPDSNPAGDPNPRLEAYIAAAGRGATVRLLLDSVFDDPGDPQSNSATCAYANGIALDRGLDLACKIGDPTGNGIHNKMVLVLDGGEGYVHTGSINGSENSSKNNREFAVQVRSRDAYDFLADVFWYDWGQRVTDVEVSDVTPTGATISWTTDPPTASWLELDSALHPVFDMPRPVADGWDAVAYTPGEYYAHLDWVNRAALTETIQADVAAIAAASFNGLVLYPSAASSAEVDPLDRLALDAAEDRGLAVGFRLEWYNPASFDWGTEDCDAVLQRYDAYLDHFEGHPGLLDYLLLNMPLDDPAILEPDPAIAAQRTYVAYCYDALKARLVDVPVYANTYYGWRDELHQAPVADLVDGLSLVVYAQHAPEAPFGCDGIPGGDDPVAELICKDQLDYYVDKAWDENRLAALGKPLLLDATGFAPAASYDDPEQRNGIVEESGAKVRAIAALQDTLARDTRLRGWSYFKLLHKDEADWGLIDRRRFGPDSAVTEHEVTLSDLFPGTVYTFTLRAGDATAGPFTFSAEPLPTPTNAPPVLTLSGPAYGHQLVAPGAELTITWLDEDPDDNASLSLYYDTNDAGCDGTPIVAGLSEDGGLDAYAWTAPPGLPAGSYYVYGLIDDGANPAECDYSSGRFVNSTVTLEVTPTVGPITLDGQLDDAAWAGAEPLAYAVHAGQPDGTTATVRALWDGDDLYFGFELDDTQVETADQDWDDDSVSLVFDNGGFRCRQDVGGSGEGDCERTLYLPPCTTLDDGGDADCGYSVEMRVRWARARITADRGDIVPADLLSVDHDGNPGGAWDHPDTLFSKVSWDGDGSVETTGRSLTLVAREYRIWLPVVLKGG